MAQYTSAKLPDFLKSTLEYKDGVLGEALQQAFMGFDATLRDDEVIKELKALAGVDDDADEDDEGKEKGGYSFEEQSHYKTILKNLFNREDIN